MPKTYKKKGGKSKGTRKSRAVSDQSLSAFQKEITVKFFETLIMIKLFHWKTTSYPTHKATDKLYTKLNANIDSFIEVLLGKSGVRTDLLDTKNMRLIDLQSVDELKREVVDFKSYLVALSDNAAMKKMANTDLFNIRDTILGDMNQLLYLLSFK
jgi:hypothetical protein